MKSFCLAFLLLIAISSYSQTDVWSNLLQKHVTDKGLVDYDAFAKDKTQLDSYLKYLEKKSPDASWSANKTKAFWINAYNAYTIKLILENFPLTSITDIKRNDLNAWEIPFAKVGGKTISLNHIEHDILRKKFNDPRIHAGVNCASISCPALPNIAFTENNIEKLLTQKMKTFVNDTSRNQITTTEIKLSQIFNWFQDDFTQQSDLITFINQYSQTKVNPSATINYIEYNWNLNKQ
ncbi:DUF547 domain-containing protein [Wenyingzhuangia sp. 1_MG-2023]|nr:DUF547 domain-containing protein [Wenyingzhuangia sp. 1_MG-2023]